MKASHLLLVLVLISPVAQSAALSKPLLVGSWETHFGYGVVPSKDAARNYLTIKENLETLFSREVPGSGKFEAYSGKDAITSVEDIVIIPYYKNGDLIYKLTLSGWTKRGNKLLFGMLYLYRDGELFNGIPVSFKPAVGK